MDTLEVNCCACLRAFFNHCCVAMVGCIVHIDAAGLPAPRLAGDRSLFA